MRGSGYWTVRRKGRSYARGEGRGGADWAVRSKGRGKGRSSADWAVERKGRGEGRGCAEDVGAGLKGPGLIGHWKGRGGPKGWA